LAVPVQIQSGIPIRISSSPSLIPTAFSSSIGCCQSQKILNQNPIRYIVLFKGLTQTTDQPFIQISLNVKIGYFSGFFDSSNIGYLKEYCKEKLDLFEWLAGGDSRT